VHVQFLLLLVIKRSFVPDLKPTPRVEYWQRRFESPRARQWIVHRLTQVAVVVFLLSGKDALAPRTVWLCDLEGLFGLSHHDVAPFEMLQTLLHIFIRIARLTVPQPPQAVARVLRRGFN
jgi:hypothetical protein